MSKLTLILETVPNGTVRASYYEEQVEGDDHVQSLKKSLLAFFAQDGSVTCKELHSLPEPPRAKVEPEPELSPEEVPPPPSEPARAKPEAVPPEPAAKKVVRKVVKRVTKKVTDE